MTEDDLARKNISNRIMLHCEPILSTTMIEAYITQRKLSSFYLDLQVNFTCLYKTYLRELSVNPLSN
jgi:hypothetical protein